MFSADTPLSSSSLSYFSRIAVSIVEPEARPLDFELGHAELKEFWPAAVILVMFSCGVRVHPP